MIEPPETQYAKKADGVNLAFQVVGDGPLDLLLVPAAGGNVELGWEIPSVARVLRRLASFSRLIIFDISGTGLSDPHSGFEPPPLEERAEEARAVLDAAGSTRAAVVANGIGGVSAIFFAATYPNRTSSLVLDGCFARLARAPDYPSGVPREVLETALAQVAENDTARHGLTHVAPHAGQDPEFVTKWGRYLRSNQSPARAKTLGEAWVYADVRPVLPTIQAPTLVLYRIADRFAGKDHAEYLAQHIPGAKLRELPGDDNLIFVGDSDNDVDEIEEFLTGARHAPDTDRVLATVLFTDIVDSTKHAAELGDRRWKDLLDKHDGAVRRQLERFGGQEIDTAGDGFLATFDGPGRGIRCACAIRDVVSALGIEVRAGMHTGEIERRGDDIAGIAVHIGARVSALAGPGEVVVSSAVPPLVAESGIEFDDRGEHELQGVPGSWRLFGVVQ